MVSEKEGNKPEVEYTGERMIPGKADEENYFEHLSRYHFARAFVEGKRLLDAGCGDGYGAALLAESASEVVGIDISREVIEAASSQYKRANLKYRAMDVESISFEKGSFDAAVCFEVFEHVRHPEKLLEGLRKILASDGVLIISTPNGALIKSGKPNPFHVKEYTRDEFDIILVNHFPESKFEYSRYGQFNLRRRGGAAEKAMKGWIKLKRRLGIGKIMPESVSRKLKDSKSESYSADDFAFSTDGIESAEYFLYVIRGKQ